MEYTEGEWEHKEDGIITASDGKQIVSVFPRDREANAYLIVEAVNACIKLNPDNPLAVAQGITDLYEALQESTNVLTVALVLMLTPETKRAIQAMIDINIKALARAEEKC